MYEYFLGEHIAIVEKAVKEKKFWLACDEMNKVLIARGNDVDDEKKAFTQLIFYVNSYYLSANSLDQELIHVREIINKEALKDPSLRKDVSELVDMSVIDHLIAQWKADARHVLEWVTKVSEITAKLKN